MKYIAPEILNTVSATDLIQGDKDGVIGDSNNPADRTPSPGYDADE